MDPATTEVATIVKMTRVALLVPVLLVLGMYLRNAASHAGGQGKGAKLPIPWFAIGFWRWPSSIAEHPAGGRRGRAAAWTCSR